MIVKKNRMTAMFSGEYCCRYDAGLTFESDPEELAIMFGYSGEEMSALCRDGFLNLVEASEREVYYQGMKEQLEQSDYVELIFHGRKKDGTHIWVMNRGYRVVDGEQEYIHGILLDITLTKCKNDKEKEKVKKLHEQVCQDSLTKIYNASTSRKLAEEYFEKSGKAGKCALLIIDLDDFKKVNDQKGHMFGDAVLIQAARAIRQLFRCDDIVGRIGGDEFMVLMKDISDKEIVKKRCQQLNEILKTIFEQENFGSMPTCSIGVGFAPEHGDSYFTVFCCADKALYKAKQLGRQQYVFYERDICESAEDWSAMQYSGYDMNILRGYLE